jgi:hypothetical protein
MRIKGVGTKVENPPNRVEELVRRLQRERHCDDDWEIIRAAVTEALKLAAEVGLAAKLPDYYQWGHDAMEQFEVGKEYAADAIRALIPERP